MAGGIASGKSQVAILLEEAGAKTVDSDAMVSEELAKPEVLLTFRDWWGEKVCTADGRIDRAAMGNIIFRDAGERARMEAFLYPRLEARRKALMAVYEKDPAARAIVMNAPLLYEVGLDRLCHTVWFVECDRATRLARAMASRGWTQAEFDRRENLQKPLDKKRSAADYIVVNSTSVDALRSQVTTFFERSLNEWERKRQSPTG